MDTLVPLRRDEDVYDAIYVTSWNHHWKIGHHQLSILHLRVVDGTLRAEKSVERNFIEDSYNRLLEGTFPTLVEFRTVLSYNSLSYVQLL
jgi:hypothetical protein